jgi:hypothetical protein
MAQECEIEVVGATEVTREIYAQTAVCARAQRGLWLGGAECDCQPQQRICPEEGGGDVGVGWKSAQDTGQSLAGAGYVYILGSRVEDADWRTDRQPEAVWPIFTFHISAQ